MCVIVSVGVFDILKVVHRLGQRCSYVLQVKCIHMGKVVWVVCFAVVRVGKLFLLKENRMTGNMYVH